MLQNNKRELGAYYEEKSVEALQKKGVKILERNFRCRQGEIDIIGMDQSCLVFFEVKYRTSEQYGTAIEAVDKRKQYKISRVADYYLLRHPYYAYQNIRFDVIGIDDGKARWIKNAFEYCEKR